MVEGLWRDECSAGIVAAFARHREFRTMSDERTTEGQAQAADGGESKPNGTTGRRYISIGTVRVRSDVGNDSIETMFFMPAKGFAVSHADKEYVALLPAAGNSDRGILAPYDSKKGLSLCLEASCPGLVEAATKQCAVEIEVEDKCENCSDGSVDDMEWPLRSIAIPAAGQTK